MKSYLIEVPDDFDMSVLQGIRCFPVGDEISAPVVESVDLSSPQLDEQEALLQQCAELSERLALFGKKKQISQRK